jgi:deazaflavin-dependent oxidoreductase (nitroreductase family)
MALDTKQGTRGGRKMHLGPIGRAVMGGLSFVHRRQGYRFQGMNLLFLTTVGKKSGQERTVPVAWYPDGEDAWLIVASAAGSIANPAWYHNIAAHPDQISVELPGGRKLRVVAEQLEGERRQQAWNRIAEEQPRYSGYQQKTDREIPILRLTPAP